MGNLFKNMDDFEGLYGISSAVVSSATPATKKRQAVPEAETSSKVQKQQQVLPSKNQPATVNAYERRNPGQVEIEFRDGQSETKENDGTSFEVRALDHCAAEGVRYMRDTLEGKAEQLETRSQSVEAALIAQHALTEVTAVGLASQEETTVVGRVCCEGEGKLNYLSLVLEGGMETSNSARVKLDVQDVKEYSLFPGQVVAARGINTTGAKMQANQIFQVAMPKSVERPSDNIRKPVVWAASGPFTSSGDLEFEAMADLLDQCVSSKPDALVLMGPFLGANHALLKQPPSDKTYTQLFQEKIGDLLDQMLDEDDCKTTVILIPSVHDVHHNHFVFPQPPFRQEDLGLTSQQARDQVQCFPNPAMFTIGGVTFGTSSCDVIKDLSSEEIASKPLQPGVGPSRIVRIASHLVQQQSFYPLFPARIGSCVDYQSVDKFAMPVKPDVLIVTSDLQRFVEKLDGDVVCCNPGRLVRGAVSGTYLRCAHNNQGSSIDVIRV